MRVLLVKLSSMGDVIHTLPALTDALNAIPAIKFTWLVEEGFQEIPAWHPAVERVIPTALRKGNKQQILTSIKQLRQEKYDLVIDAQGLIKSAVLSRLTRTKQRAGYDRYSAREGVASIVYNRKCHVAKDLHAVERLRQLFAQALDYSLPSTAADFNIHVQNIAAPITTSQPYLMFLHGTTWDSKHWPEEYWRALADLVASKGFAVHVTWANSEQQQRAQRLAAHASNVIVLPHLTINQAALILSKAQGAVAVDTGFAHLSAALSKPTVAVYGPTDISKAGTVGSKAINLASKFACAPCYQRSCNYSGAKAVNPPCFAELSPQLVWEQLANLL